LKRVELKLVGKEKGERENEEMLNFLGLAAVILVFHLEKTKTVSMTVRS